MRALKSRIEAWQGSANAIFRALARSLQALGATRRFVLNSRIRSEQITRALNRERHFQAATYTASDRYPDLFEACRQHLQGTPSPTLLSFGCATGEEVFSLAQYMPKATVVGVDINRWCLKQCRRRNSSPNIKFFHSLDPKFLALPGFDAIFCMAVFQRTEHRLSPPSVIQGGFTFERFEQQIRKIDARLKPGGLLFIDHADFRFTDTDVAQHYTPLDFPGNETVNDRPLFGPDNRLIATSYVAHRAFLKQGPPSEPAFPAHRR